MQEYTMKDAFRDGFYQCVSQVKDMFNNPELDTRAKMKAFLETLKPFDDTKNPADENATGEPTA